MKRKEKISSSKLHSITYGKSVNLIIEDVFVHGAEECNRKWLDNA
jgi:hypothetical protein